MSCHLAFNLGPWREVGRRPKGGQRCGVNGFCLARRRMATTPTATATAGCPGYGPYALAHD